VTPAISTDTQREHLASLPLRDKRFSVARRWVECNNLPPGAPGDIEEFLHRQMNEEVNSLECSAKSLADFPDSDWEMQLFLARQSWDESRHAVAFRLLYESRDGVLGATPILNFQYEIISGFTTLLERLIIQNRSFEAGGLDAIERGIDENASDPDLIQLYDSQLADEILHVRFANDWIRRHCAKKPVTVLTLGRTYAAAVRLFNDVMGPEGVAGVAAAPALSRVEAGFTQAEIEASAPPSRDGSGSR
jgi:hypothetical protein